MSEYFGAGDQNRMFRAQRETAVADATRQTAYAAQSTKELTEQLVAASLAAEARETKMLFWSRMAAIAGIVAILVTVIGIAVTLLVT